MKSTKNVTQESRSGRRPKFDTDEERRQSILESKRIWARKNLSKNKDEKSEDLVLFAVHKTSDGKTSNIYKPKELVKPEKELVENELLKEKLLAKDREIEFLKGIILTKDNENESLREIIDLLKTNNLLSKNRNESYETPKVMVSVFSVKEDKESFEVDESVEYISSDESENSDVEKVAGDRLVSEEEIKKYKQLRKKGGNNFKDYDLVIEKILSDRSIDAC